MTAFSGVRSSWLMLARKPLFAWLAVSAASFAACISRCARSRSSTSRRMRSFASISWLVRFSTRLSSSACVGAQRLLRRLARR